MLSPASSQQKGQAIPKFRGARYHQFPRLVQQFLPPHPDHYKQAIGFRDIRASTLDPNLKMLSPASSQQKGQAIPKRRGARYHQFPRLVQNYFLPCILSSPLARNRV